MKPFYLLADIGATNARVAICRERISNQKVLVLSTKNYSSIKELISEALGRLRVKAEELEACFAVAGPIIGEVATITNLGLVFSKREIIKTFGFKRLFLVNDLYAGAASLLKLRSKQLKKIKGGSKGNQLKVAIFCGTGLGVGLMVRDKPLIVQASEAGHLFLPCLDRSDEKLLALLKSKDDALEYEEVLSGRGLENLYRLMHEEEAKSQEITERASIGEPKSRLTIKEYFRHLGRFMQQVSLAFLPYGGIYLGGGVFTALQKFLDEAEFLSAFLFGFLEHRMLRYIFEPIPVYGILHPFPVLVGCSAILENL